MLPESALARLRKRLPTSTRSCRRPPSWSAPRLPDGSGDGLAPHASLARRLPGAAHQIVKLSHRRRLNRLQDYHITFADDGELDPCRQPQTPADFLRGDPLALLRQV